MFKKIIVLSIVSMTWVFSLEAEDTISVPTLCSTDEQTGIIQQCTIYFSEKAPDIPCSMIEKFSRVHECSDTCHDIYHDIDMREACMTLSVAQIDRIYQVYKKLVDPISSTLNDKDQIETVNLLEEITPEHLKDFFRISASPLVDILSSYRRKESEMFMKWLIQNDEIFDIVISHENRFMILDAILGSPNREEIYRPFIERNWGLDIKGSNNLINLFSEYYESREKFFSWFMEYINENSSQCTNADDGWEYSTACFEIYCKIGNAMTSKTREIWWNFEDFEDYIEEIVFEGVNSTGSHESGYYYWGDERNTIYDTSGVSDWVEDLCKKGAKDLTKVEALAE